MEEINFITQTLSILVLLLICSFTSILSKKINFPYTVLLVIIGIILVPISNIGVFSFIDDFQLTPDILFFIFLPVLLFEAAYNINYKHILHNWKSISALATFGLLVSGGLIASLLFFILPFVGFEIPFLVCLLFGVLISATDPVAVLSIFKTLGAPRRLTILFEGESLFNDGTAVALFVVILGIMIDGGGIITSSTYIQGFFQFLSMLFGGIAFGAITGVFFSKVIGYIKNNEEVEIVLTMLLAHFTFIGAELITHHVSFLPISGVIATVIASIVIGNYGRYKITPRVEAHMQKFWEFFAFVSNSVVFILMGLILSTVEINVWEFTLPVLICILIVIFARVVSVYTTLGSINFFKIEKKIPNCRLILLSWGSLRGALAMMMVLMIPGPGDHGYESLMAFQEMVGWSYAFSIKDFLLVLAIGVIMFTLLVKAPTTPFIMRKFKIDRLHKLEEFEYQEGKILASLKILHKLNLSFKKAYLTKVEYSELKIKYTEKLDGAVKRMKEVLEENNGTKDSRSLLRRAISLHALGIEKQYLKELFFYNEIDEKNFKYIFRKIEKQIERLESDFDQLRSISNMKNDYDIFCRTVAAINKKHSTDLDSYIRNRTRVIITRKVIKELRSLSEIEFGFDKSVFDEVINLYAKFNRHADEKRIKIFASHKATINAIESGLVNKSLLKLEEKTIKDLYHKEIITPKLYLKFMDEIEKEMYSDVKTLS